ncbi:hypothetical protein CT19431_MP120050 [Cupriavidus taiwanensis]|nr:hypothetical protein CT19431_MP120050 [Cupriavidus taiwanensis]
MESVLGEQVCSVRSGGRQVHRDQRRRRHGHGRGIVFSHGIAQQFIGFGAVEVAQHGRRQRRRGAVIDHLAVAQRDDAGAVAHGHVHLVQRHHHCHLAGAVDLPEQRHHAARGFRIERGDRLVGQDHAGVLHQRPGDGGALLLAARQRGGPLKGIVVYTNLRKRIEPAADFVGLEHAQQPAPPGYARQHADQHVGDHRQASHQVELLEHETDLAPHLADVAGQPAVALHVAAVDQDLAGAGVAGDEAGHVAQQRRLAGSGRAQQGDHFARCDLQRDIVKRLAVRTERFGQPADFNCVRHVVSPVNDLRILAGVDDRTMTGEPIRNGVRPPVWAVEHWEPVKSRLFPAPAVLLAGASRSDDWI